MLRRLVAVSCMLACLAGVTPAPSAAGAPDGRAAPTLSVSSRLGDRRYVAAGPRAYVVGTQDGRFPAMGFHTRGEMGGIWSPPIKLLDGLWFAVDGTWVGPATRFTSGYGHVRMRLPGDDGLAVSRTEFVPGNRRAVLIGLTLRAESDRTVRLWADAHSELMSAYPWGETDPAQTDYNLRDGVSAQGPNLEFRERGTPPVRNAAPHDWAALVGSTLRPRSIRTGEDFRGPQDPPVVCPPSPDEAPDRCDDTAYGKGAGGRLRYAVDLRAGRARTIWFAVAGSDRGLTAARAEHAAALRDPAAALARKIAHRQALARRTRLELPHDPLLVHGIDWSKQNLADSVQVARDLAIRETNAGTAYPPPEGTLDRVRFLGAGWPDYPWLFGTDGEYTAFASVAVGQFEPIMDHLRALRDASRIDNGGSGKVVHEVVTDGSVYFGSNADPGNTDETAKFPSAVALLWRWTGDDAFRDELYSFTVDNMRYIFRVLDVDGDGWPEGLGNVEREGMGDEKLDNTTATIRGLYDLADMAASKGDTATVRWATRRARMMRRNFERAWWMPRVPAYADSLDNPGNVQVQQRHWIGVTPMEVELTRRGRSVPGLASRAHGNAALALRETRCYSDGFGLFHTGGPGCDPVQSEVPDERRAFTLNTAIMAVGEGNYGRLGPGQQRRYTTANRRLQLPRSDEMPGAMPEVAPSPAPEFGRAIDRPFNERSMVLQAWGAYGTAWPVVHQQLGVRPDLGRNRLEVMPQVPPHARRLAGRGIRLGGGVVDVAALARGGVFVTRVRATVDLDRLVLGVTLPHGSDVAEVRLDGRRVGYRVRSTNRGDEVRVRVDDPGHGLHRVRVRT